VKLVTAAAYLPGIALMRRAIAVRAKLLEKNRIGSHENFRVAVTVERTWSN
jgi:hypothetical protein